MPDLSQMSTDDLVKMRDSYAPARDPGKADLSQLSNEELVQMRDSYAPKGLLQKGMDALDSVTGGPVRNAVGKLIDSGSPRAAMHAYADKFASPSTPAPSGRDIMKKVGVSDVPFDKGGFASNVLSDTAFNLLDPSGLARNIPSVRNSMKEQMTPANISGAGVDIATDPLTYAGPALGLLKKAGTVVKAIPVVDEAAGAIKNVAGAVKNTAGEAASELSRPITKGMGLIFKDRELAPGADETRKTVSQFTGSDIPDYLLTDHDPTKRVVDELSQSATIAGRKTAKEIEPMRDALNKYAATVDEQKGLLSPYEAGKSVKSGISAKFDDMVKPAEDIYSQIEDKFANVPLRKVSIKSALTQLRNEYLPSDLDGKAGKMLDNLETKLVGGENSPGLQTVADLRKFRSKLGMISADAQSQTEKNIVNQFYGVLTRERDRSILRDALQGSSKIGREERAKQLLGQLKEADGIYRDAMTNTTKALGVEGNRNFSSRAAIRDYLTTTPEEKVVQDLFNKNNVGQLKQLQQTFPDQFDVLRRQGLSTVLKGSSYNGNISPQRLVTNLMKFPPEVREMMMGPELAKNLGAAQKTLATLPTNFNPSGTARALKNENTLGWNWLKANAADAVKRQLLLTGKTGRGLLK